MSSAAEAWEARYAGTDRAWSGKVNVALARVAAPLSPGSALDLGCGEGGDALWLAAEGWRVTAVDIAPTALARGAARAAVEGTAERIDWLERDLGTWIPEGSFDLVSACFLHSGHGLPRTEVLRRAAAAVAPGGTLLIVGHREPPPWHRAHDDEHHAGEPRPLEQLPSPEEQLAELDLDPAAWIVRECDTVAREATGPDGQAAILRDVVVAVERVSA